MATKFDFTKFRYGDYVGANSKYFRLASMLPNEWHYFENLTWFGPFSLYQHIQENYPDIAKMLTGSVHNMIPTDLNGLDPQQLIIRNEPEWHDDIGYDFVYMTTNKFVSGYTDMRMSGRENHYVLIPLDELWRFDDIFAVIREKYFEAEHTTKKLIYGLTYNEILHEWWHGDPHFIPKIKSGDDVRDNIDLINKYIPTDIAMDMNIDREYIVFEKAYIPISEPLADEYVKLMSDLIDGSMDSTTRILRKDDNHDFKVVLNVIHPN